MKKMPVFYILCITAFVAVPSTNAEPIPLDKGNVWIYSYAKQDSSKDFYNGDTPDPVYHYYGTISLTIDSVTNSNSSNDTTFLWLAIIDSGVTHQIEWDSSGLKYQTTIKQYRNVKNLSIRILMISFYSRCNQIY